MQRLAAATASGPVGGDRRRRDRAVGSSASGGTTRVGQADAQRLGGVDHVAGDAQLLGLGDADPAGQALGAAEAGDDAELDLGLAELAPSRWRR
jgi:hypothetical protein